MTRPKKFQKFFMCNPLVKSRCSWKSEAIETRKFKPLSQSNVRLRTNTCKNTYTYTTYILIFIEIRSIEMKPIYKPMKYYTHTHTCPRIYTRLMSKNTVLCARLAPPSNLLVVGVTLLLISQFEFSVNRTERMRMFSYNHIHTSYVILCARLTPPSN